MQLDNHFFLRSGPTTNNFERFFNKNKQYIYISIIFKKFVSKFKMFELRFLELITHILFFVLSIQNMMV